LLGDLPEGRLNSIAQDSDRSTGSSREVLALGPGGRKHHLDPVLPVLLGPRLAPKPSIEQQPIQDRPHHQVIGHRSFIDGCRDDAP